MEAVSTTSSHFLTFALTFLLFISNLENSDAAITTTKTTKNSSSTYKNYLKTACNSTTYPKLCYSSLSHYYSTISNNDLTLCISAVNVSLQAATNANSLVTALLKEGGLNHTEAQAVQDCLEVIGDSIDELNESLDALGSLDFNNPKVKFQISSIKTWVSAAITDDDTCTDGLNGAKVSSSVKTKITKSVLNVERLTSNALALINSKLP
ncbi:hypothetical protein P3X46_029156 [Hevea brasiliensis]|uniref:Pectinesterase inhibitor domain-containing protein n=1 Tax=Hevea brasiliensis TaxID=3981 RepID=A0ABQ9KUE6_HEVBR|nr:pectinesterase inhibitor 10-like [Hevea brasiliensis]KAJ9146943.1 hypothetical protein P3X46_029156 [Hevea brasiliensis]